MTQIIKTLPYAQRFPAKLGEGVDADLPAAPEGLGDMYYAHDTGTLYTSNAAADGWVVIQSNPSTRDLSDVQDTAPADGNVLTWVDTNNRYEPQAPGGQSFTGVVATRDTIFSIATTATISWLNEPIDTDGYITTPSTDITIPSGKAGIYRVSVVINLIEDTGVGWNDAHLQFQINGANDVVLFNESVGETTFAFTLIRTLSVADVLTLLITANGTGGGNVDYCEMSLQLLEAT